MTLFLFQKKVLFSARKTIDEEFYGTLTYDTIDVNVGDGLQANGNFIAPESGTYGFTFSSRTGQEKSNTGVWVYKDGKDHHYIYEGNDDSTSFKRRFRSSQ